MDEEFLEDECEVCIEFESMKTQLFHLQGMMSDLLIELTTMKFLTYAHISIIGEILQHNEVIDKQDFEKLIKENTDALCLDNETHTQDLIKQHEKIVNALNNYDVAYA